MRRDRNALDTVPTQRTRHEARRLHVLNEVFQDAKTPLRILRGAPMRPDPRLTRRVGAVLKINGIPEFGSDELGRMIVNADHAAPSSREAPGRLIKPLVGGQVLHASVQIRPELILPHMEHVQKASIPEWLLMHPYLLTLVKIDGNA